MDPPWQTNFKKKKKKKKKKNGGKQKMGQHELGMMPG